jgi:hypothetical protein
METETKVIACPGCGALVPDIQGPTHNYIESAPGCWAAYGEILQREYGEFEYPPVHRLTVDVYAVQHPGRALRRASQSVALHLVSLCLMIEYGKTPEEAMRGMMGVLAHRPALGWLTPPDTRGEITVLQVRGAADEPEHEQRVRAWARSVWNAWGAHHQTIHEWLKRFDLRGV